MSSRRPHDTHDRCRLSHQVVRDLRLWRDLPSNKLDGREIIRSAPTGEMNTDAADVGYGGTLKVRDL